MQRLFFSFLHKKKRRILLRLSLEKQFRYLNFAPTSFSKA